jgi:hypothetical protein
MWWVRDGRNGANQRCDGVMEENSRVSKKPLESEVAGDAFDFPIAIARGVKPAPSADFLRLFLGAFRLFGAPRLGLGTRALSGFGNTGGDVSVLAHNCDLSAQAKAINAAKTVHASTARKPARRRAGMMPEKAWGK